MNLNPTLWAGLAAEYARRVGTERGQHATYTRNIELRVYPRDDLGGCYFVRSDAAIRWYYREASDSSAYRQADEADVRQAIEASAQVQITGQRGESYGVWMNWETCVAALEAGIEEAAE